MDRDKDTNTDMNMAMEEATPQAGSCTPTSQSAEPAAVTRTTLMTLPTELILQILSSLPLPVLLDFRLVCAWADTLVFEPVFWHQLEFSKQLLFKTGTGVGANGLQQHQQHRRTSFGLGGGASLPGGAGAGGTGGGGVEGRGGGRGSIFQHNSDANLIIHRQSLAASLLSSTTSRNEDSWVAAVAALEGIGPSITISANISASPSLHQQQQTQASNSTTLSTSPTATAQHLLPNISPWTKIETSFFLFLTRLASIPRAAQAIRTVIIEDWDGIETVQRLWAVLRCFGGVKRLAVRNCVLRHLDSGGLESCDSTDNYNGDKDKNSERTIGSWSELKILDFKDCTQLKDLHGLQAWLPHLEDLSLDGCTSIEDFSPLSSLGGDSRKEAVAVARVLVLKKASLVHTRIQDEDLIALLRRSPELEELRLDQCYGLTVRALEAIAFGDQKPAGGSSGGGVTQGLGGVEVQATSQEPQITPPYHLTANAGPAFTTLIHSPPLDPITVSSPINTPSSSSASTTTSAPLPSQQSQQSSFPGSKSFCPQLRKLSLKNCYDFTDEGIRSLVGCRHLEWLVIRGIRQVNEDTAEWLHSQGVPLRKLLSPLGRWRYWHV